MKRRTYYAYRWCNNWKAVAATAVGGGATITAVLVLVFPPHTFIHWIWEAVYPSLFWGMGVANLAGKLMRNRIRRERLKSLEWHTRVALAQQRSLQKRLSEKKKDVTL